MVDWHSPLQAQSAVHFKAALTHEQLPRHPFLQPHLTRSLLLAVTSESVVQGGSQPFEQDDHPQSRGQGSCG